MSRRPNSNERRLIGTNQNEPIKPGPRKAYVSNTGSTTSPIIVALISLVTAMAFVVILFTVYYADGGSLILPGPQGKQGTVGPPGSINISSTNETFVGTNLNLTGNITLMSNNSNLFFDNGTGSIFYNTTSQCVQIDPRLCVSEIINPNPTTSLNVTGPINIIGTNQSIILNEIIFPSPNGSAIIFFDSETDTIVILGATLNGGTLATPIYIGDSGYIINISQNELLIFGNTNISLQATNINLNGFVFIFEAIISSVQFWNNIFLSNGNSFYFSNSSSFTSPKINIELGTNGTISNFTIHGKLDNIVLRTNESIILDSLHGSGISFYGNVSFFSSQINTNIYLQQSIIFSENGASIYASGSCLVLQAPSLCFNASQTFNFSVPVQFLKPIVGDLTLDGSLNILGVLNISGTFAVQNLVVSGILNATTSFLRDVIITNSLQTLTGSVTYIRSFFTTDPAALATFGGGVQFTSSNVTSINCQLPYFDPITSGCVPLCSNHSVCNEVVASLTDLGNLDVRGNIVQLQNSVPHPCCINSGPLNYVYQKWGTNNPTTISLSATGAMLFLPVLNFNYSIVPNLMSGMRYIQFNGGNNWTVLTTGNYYIGLALQIDTTSNCTLGFFVVCGSQIYGSPTISTITGVTSPFPFPYNSTTTVTYEHLFEVQLNTGTSCSFYAAFKNGNLNIGVGNLQTLSIKMESMF